MQPTLQPVRTMQKLLITEDDVLLADALVSHLSKENFEVQHAPNGAVAEYLLTRQSFDAAVLDLGLPMVDGMDVLRRVRAAGCTVPVLILTARDRLGDRVEGLNAGADDYLVKPFDFPELLARLRAILRRHSGAPPSAPVPRSNVGALHLDFAIRRARVGEDSLDLTPREWLLLDLLVQNLGKVVSKEEIVAAWTGDRGDLPAGGTIDVYMHRLRKKLAVGSISIRTVRGLGYMLEEVAAPQLDAD